MKKVLINKRKISYKDFFYFLKTFFNHFITISLYTITIFLIYFFIYDKFVPNFSQFPWTIIYPLFIAIPLNVILSILYMETGSIIIRFITAMHSLCIILIVPLLIFLL